MKRLLALMACAAAALIAQTRSQIPDLLTFDRADNGKPAGWRAFPPAHIFSDDQVYHGGPRSVRIERQPGADQQFSGVTLRIPVDFTGNAVRFSGFVRTENVEGAAAMWMRLDGETPGLAFATTQGQNVHGTTDWTEYNIAIPVHRDGRDLYVGFLLAGTGKAWADDFKLTVDGKPIQDAPAFERPKTVLDTDHEFDTGSKIELSELTPIQIENLATLGKVWGFLKYHHPVVAAGTRHWDYDLFRILPDVLKASDRASAHATMSKWIASLGDVPACDPCAQLSTDKLHLKPENAWIESEAVLGAGLSRALQNVYRNRPTAQFFVQKVPGVGNPIFDREPGYARVHLPDAGFQILGLFRYWNIIRYWAPYRDLVGEDWDKLLPEFIPKIALAKSTNDYKLQFISLIARVHDTHANLWGGLDARPPKGGCQVPVVVRFVRDRAVIAAHFTPGAESPLKRGDIIDAIDGVSVADLVKQWQPYYAASNDPTRLRDIGRTLTVGPCGDVKLRIRRGAEALDVATARITGPAPREGVGTHDIPGDAFRLLSKDVAYVKISALKQADVAKYIDSAAGTKGLVIDIRNYPSDFPIFALGGRLVDKPTPFATFTSGDLANPGAFHFGAEVSLQPLKPRYTGKVTILVDEVSQSSAEYHSMAFRAVPGAKVIGSTTAGADGNVSQIALPGGLRTMISGIGVFYPDKRPTQRVGIVPDIVATPTVEGLAAGRDEVLEVAVREILGDTVPAAEIEKIARAGRD